MPSERAKLSLLARERGRLELGLLGVYDALDSDRRSAPFPFPFSISNTSATFDSFVARPCMSELEGFLGVGPSKPDGCGRSTVQMDDLLGFVIRLLDALAVGCRANV